MLGLIKALPLMLLIAGAGWAYHKTTVAALENRLADVQEEADFARAENVALKTAAQTNEATIKQLEVKAAAQAQQMSVLSQNNQKLNSERDEYLSIFKRHNLTKLARAKPGMIEPRINSGTSKVLRTIEQDSRELDQADDIAGEPDVGKPVKRNSMMDMDVRIVSQHSHTGDTNEEAFDDFTFKSNSN
jgi:hypothetical protein